MGLTYLIGRRLSAKRHGEVPVSLGSNVDRLSALIGFLLQAWTESFVQWSPLGSYIATVHRPGAAIWGGESWGRLARFAHPQVSFLLIYVSL